MRSAHRPHNPLRRTSSPDSFFPDPTPQSHPVRTRTHDNDQDRQKITHYLWFDKEAEETPARFYTSLFGDSLRDRMTTFEQRPRSHVILHPESPLPQGELTPLPERCRQASI